MRRSKATRKVELVVVWMVIFATTISLANAESNITKRKSVKPFVLADKVSLAISGIQKLVKIYF